MENLSLELKKLTDRFLEHTHNQTDGTLRIPKVSFVTVNLPSTTAQTATNYGLIFTATRPCFVSAISEKHTVAGTNGSPVTLQVERLQSTTALGAGTDLLATAFDLKGTAYTTQRGILAANKTTSSLSLNDSLALKVSGTLTSLEGVQVTLEITFT
jgi:hypothetical protein